MLSAGRVSEENRDLIVAAAEFLERGTPPRRKRAHDAVLKF
jgi:hypothetical protein